MNGTIIRIERDLSNLASATPMAIDMQLAELHRDLDSIRAPLHDAHDSVHYKINDRTIKYVRSTGIRLWALDQDVAEAKLAELIPVWDTQPLKWYVVQQSRELLAKIAKLRAQLHGVEAQIQTLEDEFDRRGGWTRAFKVVNANGHIHSSRACKTCRYSTRFIWLPELSGKDESEIIAYAGVWACSVCYPDAPVAHR